MTHIILVGGFLGAGKTTLLSRSAQYLMDKGYRVGVITNDQGQNLVDTALVNQTGVRVGEIAGGCFCCRFTDLQDTITQLNQPMVLDVILAEPVGSCTDLMATVIRPFRKFNGDDLTIAPLTVLIDLTREISHELEDIDYLYQQQIQEADIIAISKTDLLDAETLDTIHARYQATYPDATVISLSAKTGDGLEAWLEDSLATTSPASRVLDVDYERYAAAEADLGWLNAQGHFRAEDSVKPKAFLDFLLKRIDDLCQGKNYFIAHIKSHLKSGDNEYKASLIRNQGELLWDIESDVTSFSDGDFILNARVTTTPEALKHIVENAFEQTASAFDLELRFDAFECFSPLPPEPVYHISLEDI